MRNRFFLFILIVLVTVSTLSIIIHSALMRSERMRFVDQQVRETATALVDSELNSLRVLDFSRVEEIISEELGENRIGKFFIIRDARGEIVFESASAQVLPVVAIPQDPQWITLEKGGQFIRVLNLKLPRIENRTLQVGVLMDDEFLGPSLVGAWNLLFLLALVVSGMVISWALTSTLMAPIRRLSERVEEISNLAASSLRLPQIRASAESSDEWGVLTTGLNVLIDRVNQGYESTRLWNYQIVHELKTPLAILSAVVETAEMNRQVKREVSEELKREIFAASEMISEFLVWAESESGQERAASHVVSASRVVGEKVDRLAHQSSGRIALRVESDFKVLTEKPYLELILLNLMKNALAYSSAENPVEIIVNSPEIRIRDQGPGIPDSVLVKAGKPFNRGPRAPGDGSKSHGLGLAIVASVSRKIGVRVTYHRMDPIGTEVVVACQPLDESF